MVGSCAVAVGSWWERLLDYRAPFHPWMTVPRTFVFLMAVFCIYFALTERKKVGTDRAMLYGLLGVIVVLQEGQQMDVSAPLLVWRLPLFLVLMTTCLVSMRRYMSGQNR